MLCNFNLEFSVHPHKRHITYPIDEQFHGGHEWRPRKKTFFFLCLSHFYYLCDRSYSGWAPRATSYVCVKAIRGALCLRFSDSSKNSRPSPSSSVEEAVGNATEKSVEEPRSQEARPPRDLRCSLSRAGWRVPDAWGVPWLEPHLGFDWFFGPAFTWCFNGVWRFHSRLEFSRKSPPPLEHAFFGRKSMLKLYF